MFVIYGSRYYFQQRSVKSFGQCLACNGFGWQKSYDGSNFGHLYFIPLIPLGSRKRVLKLCSSCNQMLLVDQPVSIDMANSMIESCRQAIESAKQGQTTLPSNEGEPEPIDSFLFSSVDMLVALDATDQLTPLIEQLSLDPSMKYYYSVMNAALGHTKGPKPEVEALYLEAIENADDPDFMMAMLARYYFSAGQVDQAITSYEHVSQMHPQDPHPILVLVDLYTNTRQFDKAAEKWEQVFQLHPALMQDKKSWKLYAKVCKKAGRQPVAAV
ncbi:MAG: hypothetical protein R3B96_05595 [Pirellulaceae bacterium]|nr:hypothetical protein [Planctomycetales bacterium]